MGDFGGINIYKAGYDWKDPHAYSHEQWNGRLDVPMDVRERSEANMETEFASFGDYDRSNPVSIEKHEEQISDKWRDEYTPNYWKAYHALDHANPESVKNFVLAKDLYMAGWRWICELINEKWAILRADAEAFRKHWNR